METNTNKVVVLDVNYQFIHVESLKKALRKLIKGKAEVIKTTGKVLWKDVLEPIVIRLLKSISHFYNRVLPWSKANIYVRDHGVCMYCGSTEGKMTIDHIHPKSKGGKNTYQNTVLACYTCNQKKGDKDLADTNMALLKQPRNYTLYEAFASKMNHLQLDYNSIY